MISNRLCLCLRCVLRPSYPRFVLIVSPSHRVICSTTSLAPLQRSDRRDELERYLRAPIEDADDPIQWWNDRRALYPRLSQIAIDFLTIPSTSVDVEHLFSKGRLILSHVHSRLSVQTTRALLCLNSWISHGFVKTHDVEAVARFPDVEGDEEPELEEGWDSIVTSI
ncbi:hATC-domain-containing protein [Schizophyllum commune Tattone D]|nr:hATC-domain-containing protein [Schizophyllum commune Tattone D]